MDQSLGQKTFKYFQGNGHERDLGPNERVFILDVFNPSIYPRDHVARGYIDREVHVDRRMSDQTYLQLLETALSRSLDQFHPNLVIYNAGTDCLDGDALGGLAVTEQVYYVVFWEVLGTLLKK